jgi:hypothetical protein
VVEPSEAWLGVAALAVGSIALAILYKRGVHDTANFKIIPSNLFLSSTGAEGRSRGGVVVE